MSTKQKPNFGKRLNDRGLEVLSKVKTAVHVKLRRPVSEHERFRRYIDAQSKAAALAGEDTYEEFMDFGSDEDFVPTSQYELVVDPRTGKEVLPAEKIWLDQQRAAFDQAEALKRKAVREEKAKAFRESDYVTQPEPAHPKKSSKKAPFIPHDDQE